jgi:hypothetical protein
MKSFLHGKKAVPVAPLRSAFPPNVSVNSAPPAKPPGSPETHPHRPAAQPTVEVIKEGDKVVRVVVVCACGERIDIECLYQSGA